LGSGIEVAEIKPRLATRAELERVHAPKYLDEVLIRNETSQWNGSRPDLAELATLFAGGTLTALELLLSGHAKTAIHFPGAKHHAQYDHSSGFCVFADFALAAEIATRDFGKRVAILDIDGHHGDGTEISRLIIQMYLRIQFMRNGSFREPGMRAFRRGIFTTCRLFHWKRIFTWVKVTKRLITV
jgi:acetoin utilization deacetylase AcuC-like enzyme